MKPDCCGVGSIHNAAGHPLTGRHVAHDDVDIEHGVRRLPHPAGYRDLRTNSPCGLELAAVAGPQARPGRINGDGARRILPGPFKRHHKLGIEPPEARPVVGRAFRHRPVQADVVHLEEEHGGKQPLLIRGRGPQKAAPLSRSILPLDYTVIRRQAAANDAAERRIRHR